MKPVFFFVFLVLSCLAMGQTLDGISAPVSRTVSLAADEATFSVAIGASLDATPAQVKEALQAAGLPNPTVVATGLGMDQNRALSGPVLAIYSASVVIPSGSAIETAKGLDRLRNDLKSPLQSLQYSVAFNPSQAKVDAMRAVVLPQLLDDSRKLAQSLAAASGVKVGAIRWISDTAGGVVPTGLQRNGDFTSLLGAVILTAPFGAPSSTQYTYSLNVVFATAP
jgi:uncharacterized protein YggE